MLPAMNLRHVVSDTPSENPPNSSRQEGLALLIAVIALSVFSLLGLYVTLNATTEVRISENYESRQQAGLAARAGLNHARELIRGLELNDLLRGPDGLKPDPSTYPSTLSGRYAFRNWVNWSTARSLNILNPGSAVSGLPDDGLFNTGDGTILIPATGIGLTAPNPYGAGTVITARYFVKVTDNDDGDNDPFTDKDGIVIVRSTGVAQTIRETGGGTARANSVAVYEARFKRSQTFGLRAPIILEGDPVEPAKSTNMFAGNSFNVNGGAYPYGIGTIDTNTSNTSHPEAQVEANIGNHYDQVTGQCCPSTEAAVGDITGTLTGDQLDLLDPAYVWNLIYNVIPAFADNKFQGNQQWSGNGTPNLGTPQSPRLTYVNGDLAMGGGVSGAGVLVVTGELKGNGKNDWTGLILVIGKGVANMSGMNIGINGGIYVINLQAGNPPTFGTTQFSVGGNSRIQADETALHLGMENLPPVELSRREVTSSMDP